MEPLVRFLAHYPGCISWATMRRPTSSTTAWLTELLTLTLLPSAGPVVSGWMTLELYCYCWIIGMRKEANYQVTKSGAFVPLFQQHSTETQPPPPLRRLHQEWLGRKSDELEWIPNNAVYKYNCQHNRITWDDPFYCGVEPHWFPNRIRSPTLPSRDIPIETEI